MGTDKSKGRSGTATPVEPRSVTILGSTGSIGVNTLDVISRHPGRYRVMALTAHSQTERLFSQCEKFRPRFAVLAEPAAAERLRTRIRAAGLDTEVLTGTEGLLSVVQSAEVDIVMAAIVGAAGLVPTLAAVKAGKRVLLANKEPLVMCGHLFIEAAAASGAELLPIDSEHNAIFQCMPAGYRPGSYHKGVTRILLTCSGGPFHRLGSADLNAVTPEQACAHPTWDMGKKISVDSATLMNKGLELIEACWLFNVEPDAVDVVIHPQSIVHSLVQYRDGSVLAQMGNPDMRTPIAHALAWPERIASGVGELDLYQVAHLDFERPDLARFPCLAIAYRVARRKGTAPAVMNAANEVAVEAFLNRQIGFTDIPVVIDATLAAVKTTDEATIEAVLESDNKARAAARSAIAGLRRPAVGVQG